MADEQGNAGQPPEGGQGGQGGAPEGGGTGQAPEGGQGGAQPPEQQPPAQQQPPGQQPAEGQTFSADYVQQLHAQIRAAQTERDEARSALTPAQEQARARAIEVAVYRAAPGKNAAPAALLDSVGFREAVAKLNPESDTFTTSVERAIEKAIETNPGLAVGPRRSGGADFAGGGNQSGRQPKSLSEAVTAHYTT